MIEFGKKGKLFIVATPIGNFEDITLRALRVLGEVDMIFCEDTREGKKLLNHYKIDKLTDSFHAQSNQGKTEKIIELLEAGKNVALISDAGTPGISDPGVALVHEARVRLPEAEIISIPGPSALTAALSISGIPTDEFIFYGFLPHKKGRQTIFKEIAELKRTAVFYESPHRIIKTLESLRKHAPDKKITIARELTKIHEEILAGSAEDVLAIFQNNPEKSRGEFVVIISAE
ncbi:16S rRNA (cytidine(1402)-2'-O)-methyltransferase [Patescibacteria group bacterium]|nr:16S rRNA (cytidine(1402)-2'-O)-methyltransferase [Patescibacteria group bacterium]